MKPSWVNITFPSTLRSLIKSNATCNKFACRTFPAVRINPFFAIRDSMQILAANCLVPLSLIIYGILNPES